MIWLHKIVKSKLIALFCALLVFSTLAFNVYAQQVNLQFKTYTRSGIPEQDVFIENPLDFSQLTRPKGEDAANLEKQLFASTDEIKHDTFKIRDNTLGSYSKGKPLGFTLGDWLKAEGSGEYKVNGNTSEMNLSFRNLVPNGLYTIWCAELSRPPKLTSVYLPCGNFDGSQNVIHSDNLGNGSYTVSMPKLAYSSHETLSTIMLAYHSDNMTYGNETGPFGFTTHIHLFAELPQAAKPVIVDQQPQRQIFNPLWIIVVLFIGGGILGLFLLRRKKSTPTIPTLESNSTS